MDQVEKLMVLPEKQTMVPKISLQSLLKNKQSGQEPDKVRQSNAKMMKHNIVASDPTQKDNDLISLRLNQQNEAYGRRNLSKNQQRQIATQGSEIKHYESALQHSLQKSQMTTGRTQNAEITSF